MKVLIVSATKTEIAPILKQFRFLQHISPFLSEYSHQNIYIDVLITGIGTTATTYQLTKTIHRKNQNYNLLINAGIAGSFNREIQKAEVVNVVRDEFADLGIDDNGTFYTVFENKLLKNNTFPFVNGILENTSTFENATLKSNLNSLIKVKAITSGIVHGSQNSIDNICSKFDADIETMEGAAFFYVALSENLPCIQIRSISNYIEPRNKKNWDIPLSINSLNEFLVALLSKISI